MLRFFDKQFLFFLTQNLLIGICGLIDTSFGNHINIDSICVLSAYTVITWTTYCTYSIGTYAYRVVLDKAKACFYIQLVMSVVLGICLYLLSSVVPHIYSLTDGQYILFERCLKIHAISLPVLGIQEFLSNYMEYQCKNKPSIIGNVILHSSMIITDALVIYFHKDLTWLLRCTLLCGIIYCLFALFASGFLKEKSSFSFYDIKDLLKHGSNTLFDRLTGKVATIVFNIYASKLGMHLYSIHAVCYAIGIFTEKFSTALHVYEVVTAAKERSGIDKYRCCIRITKKYALFIIIGAYLFSYLILLFIHGDVDITDCIPFVALYSIEILGTLVYETMGSYLISERQTSYMKYGGIIGICVRIPIVLIGYYLHLGLVPFAIASGTDFLMRGVYFYIVSRRILNDLDRNPTPFRGWAE